MQIIYINFNGNAEMLFYVIIFTFPCWTIKENNKGTDQWKLKNCTFGSMMRVSNKPPIRIQREWHKNGEKAKHSGEKYFREKAKMVERRQRNKAKATHGVWVTQSEWAQQDQQELGDCAGDWEGW